MFQEMTAMQFAKQKLVNRLFDKVQVGNFNTIVSFKGNNTD
jgi:hypothetical protein